MRGGGVFVFFVVGFRIGRFRILGSCCFRMVVCLVVVLLFGVLAHLVVGSMFRLCVLGG